MAIAHVNDLKARNLKCRIEANATASGLQTAVNDWLKALTEEVVIDVKIHVESSSNWVAVIFYTE